MALYAAKTSVPVQRSRMEIEDLLTKHHASQYATAHDRERGRAVVQFKLKKRIVRFEVQLPAISDRRREQLERQRWRALLLVIKAKLECVESGIATFEEEFLAHIVLPNDKTVGEVIVPRIQIAYDGGQLLLSEGSEGRE